MKAGDMRIVRGTMIHSETGAHWLAGVQAIILEVDDGEIYEPTIVKVRASNERHVLEDVWMDPRDFVPNE